VESLSLANLTGRGEKKTLGGSIFPGRRVSGNCRMLLVLANRSRGQSRQSYAQGAQHVVLRMYTDGIYSSLSYCHELWLYVIAITSHSPKDCTVFGYRSGQGEATAQVFLSLLSLLIQSFPSRAIGGKPFKVYILLQVNLN
jgi:hypothetical protein